MIERGKVKPWQTLYAIYAWDEVVEVEYIKHWGNGVRVRQWIDRIITRGRRRGKRIYEAYCWLEDPEFLFTTRSEAQQLLDEAKGMTR